MASRPIPEIATRPMPRAWLLSQSGTLTSINGLRVGVGVGVDVGEGVGVLGTSVLVGVRVAGFTVLVTVGDNVGVEEGKTRIFWPI